MASCKLPCPKCNSVNDRADISEEGYHCPKCGPRVPLKQYLKKSEGKLTPEQLEEVRGLMAAEIKCASLSDAVIRALQGNSQSLLNLPKEAHPVYHLYRARLAQRGITDQIIREQMLGVTLHGSVPRVTIPIKDDLGRIVAVKYYSPGGLTGTEFADAPKFAAMKGVRGGNQLYPNIEQITRFDKVLICGGEMKALLAAELLNKHGWGAVACTCGEGKWLPEWCTRFTGKRTVYLADIDKAGRTSERVMGTVFSRYQKLEIARLPLELEKYPNGDLCDYICGESHTDADLLGVLENAAEFVPEKLDAAYLAEGEAALLSMSNVHCGDWRGTRISLPVVVAAIDDGSSSAPRTLLVDCQAGSEPYCSVCPVYTNNAKTQPISPEHPAILEAVGAQGVKELKAIHMRLIGIPEVCRKCSITASAASTVKVALVESPSDLDDRTGKKEVIEAYFVDQEISDNEQYVITGRVHAHPRGQRNTLLVSKAEVEASSLANFALTTDEREQFASLMRPASWTAEAIEARLDTVYSDIETNITRIYGRRGMHLLVDLAYHSPLLLELEGKKTKGTLDVLIVGDSSQGKSEVCCGVDGNGGLLRHYRLGTKVDCKSATVAGLLGGVDTTSDKRRFVKWGVIPRNDMGLVILEELKGADPEVISKLTDCRSSQEAQIAKIKSGKTFARTRLVSVSNPPKTYGMEKYTHGVNAIVELIPAPENIRRFDAVMCVNNREVPDSLIYGEHPPVEHTYTGDLCRQLVLWAWTRTREQVVFMPEAVELLAEKARKFAAEFEEVIPIFDKGSGRLKLARLAAALAARTYSCGDTEDTFDDLIVRACHVEYVCDWLYTHYCGTACGYKAYSEAFRAADVVTDPARVLKAIANFPDPLAFAEGLLRHDEISPQHIRDMATGDRFQAESMVGLLVNHNALVQLQGKTTYRRSKSFTTMLKDGLQRGLFQSIPTHLRKSGDF